jgi:hypothetical protein
MDWMDCAQDLDRWGVFFNKVMNLQSSINV